MHPINPHDPPDISTKGDDTLADAAKSSMTQDSGEHFQYTAPEPLLPSPDPLSVETSTPAPDSQAETSTVERARIALRHAEEAKRPIDGVNTRNGVISRIKWLMDTVSPVAELHPFAKMAYNLISAIPQTLLEQYQRDKNVLALLGAMRDAFDFTNHEDTLKSIKPDSKQVKILTLMLQDICNCGDFIQSYAKDLEFWKRTLKNVGGGASKEIEDLSAALAEHRRTFFDQAIIATEITAFQILDDVGIIKAKVDWMSTHLEWVSSQVSDDRVDAKISEIPYGAGSRFTPSKGCLPGTRTAFLDFIVKWVDGTASERSLVLFGQAGTGKSSIAHEIARRFDKMHRLTSSFIFLRKEQHKPHHLFTTLARDLADRYPSFKSALGRIIMDDTSLRIGAGTRDYDTLFESLILEPLKGLHIVGPVVVVIDALDESGDVTRGDSLHKFLAKNLYRLPPNFRVFITSRPEDAIKSAFVGVGALSVRIESMDDPELAAETHGDILTFLRTKLDSDELNIHCDALATKAEGLFQWAAVACGYILEGPLEFFDFSRTKCIKHLLKLTADRHRPDPLDKLYDEVLKGYFTTPGAQRLFRSVVGQLIAASEPLSIRSLIALRPHASIDDDSDAESVRGMLGRLGSLLSNVNSSEDNFPVIPLHTSFRDFLTNKEKSGDFYVDLRNSHRHLAHSCLSLMLRELKFNICKLESSYLANHDVHDLKSRIAEHIPPTLLYACRFWDDHLERIDFEIDMFAQLRIFFEKKLLFWLEALSVTRNLGLALPALSVLDVWLASGQGVSFSDRTREIQVVRP
ncbi:hypothetical protein EDB85DRAFT_269188 [Lactarius pseudohatsudake]|nr:hypothetical protein EDB85DRAFT_269188 [Lactarius pseudohatsudake]